MKFAKKLTLFILVISMLVCHSSVLAVTTSSSPNENAENDVFIVSEDVSRRGEFEKHYLCSDGTFVAVTYPEAIHYKDSNDAWADVENEVKYITSTKSYGASNQTFKATFASSSGSERLVTLTNGEHTLSWGIMTDKPLILPIDSLQKLTALAKTDSSPEMSVSLKNAGDTISEGKAYISSAESFELKNASGGIAYENIIPNAPEISVDYSVFHNKIEEDVYINFKTDIRSLSMTVSAGTLSASVNGDGSVSFTDINGEEQYRVGIPYMEDASGDVLNDISVKATQNGSSCIITYTPNEEWFTSDDREYPILFDPSITTKEYSSNIVDTYVVQGDTANHSAEQRNYVGVRNSKIHRTFIKISNLPAIDGSMPVIGATLTFTLTTGTTTGKTVGIYKLNSSWSASTVTYGNQPSVTSADRIGTYDYTTANKYVFDLTSEVSNMYSDFLAGNNHGYVIKYEDESLTNPDYNVTYATEYTKAASRPVMTITYGYSLPSGLVNGGVYALQPYASLSYLTVCGGVDANDTNVIIKQTAAADIDATQQFKLEYVSSTGAYRFRAMCSSGGNGRALDIVRSGGYVNDGGNVQIYNPTDVLASEWFIVGVGISTFKIIPRTNMALSLTVCPGGDGTATGTSPTSVGNVFVSTHDDGNDCQKWNIRDMSTGNLVSSGVAGSVASGVYYLNNRETGKYLYKPAVSTAASAESGLIADLGSSIRWQISHIENGKYTIQSTADPTLFVQAVNNASIPTLSTLASSSDIPDNFLWKITTASGGGAKIQNVATGQYIKSNGAINLMDATLPSSSTNDYDYFVWRVANANTYGNTSAHSKRELTSGFGIEDERIDVHEIRDLTITNAVANTLWTSFDDFSYSYLHSMFFSYSENGFVGESRGPTLQVIATHKVTGLSTTFDVTVNSNIETFAWRLGQLYDIAKAYQSQSQKKTLELVFNFIRGQKYNEQLWQGIAGVWNEDFRVYVYNNDREVYEYFICSTSSDNLDYEEYLIMLPDPASSDELDVLHMCATLNRYFYTGETEFSGISMSTVETAVIASGIVIGGVVGGLTGTALAEYVVNLLEKSADDLSGWAGDFQSLIRDYYRCGMHLNANMTSDGVYSAFYPLIGNDDFYCSYTDIISDMDSSNIRDLLLGTTITSGSDLEAIVLDYYYPKKSSSENIASKRFTYWMDGMTGDQLYDNVIEYCDDYFPVEILALDINLVKWPLLDECSIYDYEQIAFASAIVDYLLTQRSYE